MSKAPSPQEHLKIGDSIGAHCDIPTCHVLDFLPFKCESCKGTYCLDHRSETAHKCPQAGLWARKRAEAARASSSSPSSSSSTPIKPTGGRSLTSTCHLPSCNTTLDTPMQPRVTCSTCHHDYCLKHRLGTSHNCTPPPTPQATQAKQKAVSALNRFKAWTSTLPKAASSKISALNNPNSSRSATAPDGIIALRKVAKGDAKVQPQDRVYVWAAAAGEGELKREGMWFDKKWKVGRVLDKAAEGLRIENKNNVGSSEEDRLRVFWVEGGRVLEFSETIGTVKNADTVVLLRGVGEA